MSVAVAVPPTGALQCLKKTAWQPCIAAELSGTSSICHRAMPALSGGRVGGREGRGEGRGGAVESAAPGVREVKLTATYAASVVRPT